VLPEFRRRIRADDGDRLHREKTDSLELMERLTTYDDVSHTDPNRFEHWDEISYPDKTGCHRPKWSYATYPTCNSFHELPMERVVATGTAAIDPTATDEVRYLGRGHFRNVWSVVDARSSEVDSILKTNRVYERRYYKNYAFSQTQVRILVLMCNIVVGWVAVRRCLFGYSAEIISQHPLPLTFSLVDGGAKHDADFVE